MQRWNWLLGNWLLGSWLLAGACAVGLACGQPTVPPRDGGTSGGTPDSGQSLSDAGAALPCTIGGAHYAVGAVDPLNPCSVCDPTFSTVVFSPIPDETPCTVNGGTICVGGACVDDCLLAGQPVSKGAISPTNPCLVCDPARAVTAGSPAADGTACSGSGGNYCQAGACVSACLINGTLAAAGSFKDDLHGACCAPALSASAWTAAFAAPTVSAMGPVPQAFGHFAVAGTELAQLGATGVELFTYTAGTFTAAGTVPLPPQALFADMLAVGDFNGDGLSDLAVHWTNSSTNEEGVEIFENQSDGGFVGVATNAFGPPQGQTMTRLLAAKLGARPEDQLVAEIDIGSKGPLGGAPPSQTIVDILDSVVGTSLTPIALDFPSPNAQSALAVGSFVAGEGPGLLALTANASGATSIQSVGSLGDAGADDFTAQSFAFGYQPGVILGMQLSASGLTSLVSGSGSALTVFNANDGGVLTVPSPQGSSTTAPIVNLALFRRASETVDNLVVAEYPGVEVFTGVQGNLSQVVYLGDARNPSYATPVDVNADGITDLVVNDPQSPFPPFIGSKTYVYLGQCR